MRIRYPSHPFMVLREGLLGRKDIRRRRESVVSRKSLIARERGKKIKAGWFRVSSLSGRYHLMSLSGTGGGGGGGGARDPYNSKVR